jgi:hypothetical protein
VLDANRSHEVVYREGAVCSQSGPERFRYEYWLAARRESVRPAARSAYMCFLDMFNDMFATET